MSFDPEAPNLERRLLAQEEGQKLERDAMCASPVEQAKLEIKTEAGRRIIESSL